MYEPAEERWPLMALAERWENAMLRSGLQREMPYTDDDEHTDYAPTHYYEDETGKIKLGQKDIADKQRELDGDLVRKACSR